MASVARSLALSTADAVGAAGRMGGGRKRRKSLRNRGSRNSMGHFVSILIIVHTFYLARQISSEAISAVSLSLAEERLLSTLLIRRPKTKKRRRDLWGTGVILL